MANMRMRLFIVFLEKKTGGLRSSAPPVNLYSIPLSCSLYKPALDHDFSDLDRIEGCAFPQLVSAHPQV